MADSNPKYVRLCNRLTRGMMADTAGGSGWSIAGLDVKPFPDSKYKLAVKYVKKALREGFLEPASKAEYEEVKDATLEAAMLKENPDFLMNAPVQEAKLQEATEEQRERVIKAREAADAAREAEEAEEDDDDEDSSEDASGDEDEEETPVPAKKAAAKGKGKSKK